MAPPPLHRHLDPRQVQEVALREVTAEVEVRVRVRVMMGVENEAEEVHRRTQRDVRQTTEERGEGVMRVSQTGREKEVKWREMLERAQYRGHLSHSCDMLDLLSFKRIL